MKYITSAFHSMKGRTLLKVSGVLLLVFFTLITCTKKVGDATTNAEKTCACGTIVSVNFGPAVPGDNKLVTGQLQADCFAWAEFVALNWPANSGAGFGTPGDLNPVQWENYMEREVLMTPDGSPPPAWGGMNSPKAPAHMVEFLKGYPPGTKLLYHTSKFNSKTASVLDETGQAFPTNLPNWLGAQNGTNIWYEVLVNEDEYNYIVQKGYYNANTQYDSIVTKNGRVDLPKGDDKRAGALEIKASWMEVTNPSDARWKRYKQSNAVLVDPRTGRPRAAVVALIGLHILHKTASQPTWFWATFEHVDNVPGLNAPTPAGGYNLFNASCQPKQVNVPGGCGQNPNKKDSVYTVTCTPNLEAPFYLCNGAGPVPMQVVREIPIDPQAQQANKLMQSYIAQNFPGSVWANYQLVNMIWSTTPQTVQNNRTPQGLKSMQPVIPVANSASETFIQTATCFACHQGAPIASSAQSADNSKYSADFSFVLEFANYPGSPKR